MVKEKMGPLWESETIKLCRKKTVGRQNVLDIESIIFLGLIITMTHKATAIGPLEISSQRLLATPEEYQDVEVTAFKWKNRLKPEMEVIWQYKSFYTQTIIYILMFHCIPFQIKKCVRPSDYLPCHGIKTYWPKQSNKGYD